MDLDFAKEAAFGFDHPEQQNCNRDTNGRVDTVLDAREHGDEDSSEEYNHFDRRNSPELVDCVGWCDQITDSVDDYSRQRCAGNVEEDSWQCIDSEKHHNSGDDTSERSTHTSLGLDSSSRE